MLISSNRIWLFEIRPEAKIGLECFVRFCKFAIIRLCRNTYSQRYTQLRATGTKEVIKKKWCFIDFETERIANIRRSGEMRGFLVLLLVGRRSRNGFSERTNRKGRRNNEEWKELSLTTTGGEQIWDAGLLCLVKVSSATPRHE